MRKLFFLFIVSSFIMIGCSNETTISQLSYDSIKDLPIEEQAEKIVDNIEIYEDSKVIIDENVVAVFYETSKVHDSTLILSDKKNSFPNAAMITAEHLKVLNFDEVIVTTYEADKGGLTRVSALFTKETLDNIDFDRWHEQKEEDLYRLYTRYSDAYQIQGMIWERLNDEIIDKIKDQRLNYDSEFWDYYGHIADFE